jgi:hypothetical protein
MSDDAPGSGGPILYDLAGGWDGLPRLEQAF